MDSTDTSGTRPVLITAKNQEANKKSPYVSERSVVSHVGSLSRKKTTNVIDAISEHAVITEK
jgi:hypothetical protein